MRNTLIVIVIIFVQACAFRNRPPISDAWLFRINLWGGIENPSFFVQLHEDSRLVYVRSENSIRRTSSAVITLDADEVASFTNLWAGALQEVNDQVDLNLADGTHIRIQGKLKTTISELRTHIGHISKLPDCKLRSLIYLINNFAPPDFMVY